MSLIGFAVNSTSEQDAGFICLLIAAVFVGYLVELPKPPEPEPVSAQLQTYKLTGRDENGRQTLEYGYE